jgi:hypothetical protein
MSLLLREIDRRGLRRLEDSTRRGSRGPVLDSGVEAARREVIFRNIRIAVLPLLGFAHRLYLALPRAQSGNFCEFF